jgi:polysaccharide deacetylase 2 family uncharacterized protein YibQ
VESDDLRAPLGREKPKKKRALPVAAPQMLAGLLGMFGLVVVGWALVADNPLGGEPVVVVSTPGASGPGGAAEGAGAAGHDGQGDGGPVIQAGPAKPVPPAGAKTVTIIDGSSGQRQDVVVPGNSPANPAAEPRVDRELLETTPQGAIPQIGPDGARAYARYANPRDLPANRTDAPRIAIVLGGMGISGSATTEALAKLPAPVTLAFAPYANELAPLAARARAKGHELLLQVPMEPFDYPNNDPGPRTLLTSLADAQNVDRLHWLMGRMQGYVGLMNYMGGKFTASEEALGPVLREAAKRGLIYVDDGGSTRSVAAQLAGSQNLPFVKADIVLDASPAPAEIERALARLELAARDNGSAVGFASAHPAAIARIAAWAKTVEGRGMVLVPISMVAVKAKST